VGVTVRTATVADLPALLGLERNVPSAAHWAEQQYADIFSDVSQRLCLVIVDGAVLHGFLVAHRVGPEWELENIVVDPTSQQRGFGSGLIRRLVDEAQLQAAEAIFLEVRQSNAAAGRLYAKYGFVESGRRKSYYSDPQEDAILYSLQLHPGAKES
jgi:[ribosomal protein S18]-alanine N-acetyltransferase